MSYPYKKNELPSFTFGSLEKIMGGRDSKRLSYALIAHKENDETLKIKQHGNTIATYHSDGSIVFDNCGWYSITTKTHLNNLVPFGALYQHDHDWFWAPTWGADADAIEWLGVAKFDNGTVSFGTWSCDLKTVYEK